MSSVLIVDDESPMRDLLVRWIAPAGHETTEAPDAETALDLMSRSAFQVVLSDMQMPGHGGLWLVERIRERFPRVAILLATAVETVPPAVSMQDGIVAYLVKPFEREQVLAAVSRAVEWHEAAKARGAEQPAADDSIEAWLNGGGSGKR